MSEEELRSMEVLALFTQAIWQSAVVAKALESLSIFHSNVLARHLFHFFQLGLGEVWLVILARVPCEKDIRTELANPSNEVFHNRLAILKLQEAVVIA